MPRAASISLPTKERLLRPSRTSESYRLRSGDAAQSWQAVCSFRCSPDGRWEQSRSMRYFRRDARRSLPRVPSRIISRTHCRSSDGSGERATVFAVNLPPLPELAVYRQGSRTAYHKGREAGEIQEVALIAWRAELRTGSGHGHELDRAEAIRKMHSEHGHQ